MTLGQIDTTTEVASDVVMKGTNDDNNDDERISRIRYGQQQQQQQSLLSSSQLRLRSSTSTISSTSCSSSMNNHSMTTNSQRPLMLQPSHRLSSNELMELEEQKQQQQQQQQQPTLWNGDNNDDEDSEEEDDNVEGQSLSMSDDDDDNNDSAGSSADDSGPDSTTNDVTCGGIVDDSAVLLLQQLVTSTTSIATPSDDHYYHSNNNNNNNNNNSCMIKTLDEYSPKLKQQFDKKNSTTGNKQQPLRRFLKAVSSLFRTSLYNNDDDNNNMKHAMTGIKRKMDTPQMVGAFDIEQYMLRREMSVVQEQWNALTVLPNPAYCIYFILSAQWILLYNNNHDDDTHNNTFIHKKYPHANDWFDSDHTTTECLSSTFWHVMPVVPPFPVMAVALGICCHAPWSFLYHWTYAHTMSATQRTKHWSRRMDQSFIHIASMILSYGSSGSVQYFLINALYNMDCVRRQFRPTVRPKQNQIRILISILAYTLPILKRGEYITFVQLWCLFGVSGYFFVHYPVGGWSHAVFHIIIAFVPPLLLRTATNLPISQTQLYRAALCMAATPTVTATIST